MTVQDIIGTKISLTFGTIYEIVQGNSPWTFALKGLTDTYNSVQYTIEYFLKQVDRDYWKVIEEPKQKQNTMEKQYITVKDLPDIAVGTISLKTSKYGVSFKSKDGGGATYNRKVVETSDFFREYIGLFMPKKGDYLYCHTALIMNGGSTEEATQGKIYKCETSGSFVNNSGNRKHWFGDRGAGEWFRLATEEEIKTYKDTNKEVKITVGNPATEVKIYRNGTINAIHPDGYNFTTTSIEKLNKIIVNFTIPIEDYISGYSITVKEVMLHIGCGEGIDIALSDLRKIVDAYNKM